MRLFLQSGYKNLDSLKVKIIEKNFISNYSKVI